jgi:hypothetical protein
MSDPDSIHDVFLSHKSKDKAAVFASSLSASNGERGGVRCRNGHFAVRPKEAGLRLWFDEWEIPVAAKIEAGLPHSQLAFQPSPFTFFLTPHQGLHWRNLPGSTGCRL